MEEVLTENLGGHTFESSNAEQLSNSLATVIRNRLKGIQNYFVFFFHILISFLEKKEVKPILLKRDNYCL